jgi:hypothetical protein
MIGYGSVQPNHLPRAEQVVDKGGPARQLLLPPLLLFRLPDVSTDCLLIQFGHADATTPGPEVISREVAFPTRILPMDPDRGFPFHETNCRGYA